MKTTSGSAIFSESRPPRRAPVWAFLAAAALVVAALVAHHQGLRIVRVDTGASGSATPAFVSRSELARIEQQYQERLEALRGQLQDERARMREEKQAHAAEVAAIHRVDKTREIESLRSEKAAAIGEMQEAKSRLERSLQSQIAALGQERDRLQKQALAQGAAIKREQNRLEQQFKREQSKLEQQYKRQLGELQRRLAGTVERIAQIEGAQLTLMKNLGVKPAPQSRPRGGQGGVFQPLDRPRPGVEGFDPGVSSLRDDLDLLERAIAPIEQTWRSSLMPLTQRPVALPLREAFYISSHYGLRTDPLTRRASRHDGVDLVARHGTPVHATAAGRVKRSGAAGPHGQMVEIDHENGYVTRYAHLSQRAVRVGQRVELGQMIGRVGRTGRATGVHLHYELLHNGRTIDPTRAFNRPLWAQYDRRSFSYR